MNGLRYFYSIQQIRGGQMGNSNKKVQHPPPEDIKIGHQKFTKFTYHDQQDLLEINLEMNNEKDLKMWDSQLKRLNSFEDKQSLLLPTKHQFNQKGFCGTSGIVKIYYENYPYLFEEEIENRIEMNKHFEEEELWYLLYSLVSSASDFNRIDSKIGDVRPYNIFINEEGQIKVANIYSWPYENTNFEKTVFHRTLTYLSPEQMRLINKGMQENTTNKVTSESFSIGLTLLQSGLLFNAKKLYSTSDFTVNLDDLNRKISQWSRLEFTVQNDVNRRYSPLLRNIVAAMCNTDERQRLVSLQVGQMLRPYQNQILNLKEFQKNNITYFKNQQPQEVNIARRSVGWSPPKNVQNVQAVQQIQQPQPVRQTQQPPPLIIQQQRVVVNQPQVRYTSQPPPQGQGAIRFNTGETVFRQAPEGQRYVERSEVRTQSAPNYQQQQQFNRYANSNQYVENRPLPQSNVPMVSYENQFQKYSNLNNDAHRQAPPTFSNKQTVKQTAYYSQQPATSINYNSTGSSPKPWDLPNPTTTSQFSRPQTNSQVVSSMAPPDSSNDFLRKIDQQLEASRRQFPNR